MDILKEYMCIEKLSCKKLLQTKAFFHFWLEHFNNLLWLAKAINICFCMKASIDSLFYPKASDTFSLFLQRVMLRPILYYFWPVIENMLFVVFESFCSRHYDHSLKNKIYCNQLAPYTVPALRKPPPIFLLYDFCMITETKLQKPKRNW